MLIKDLLSSKEKEQLQSVNKSKQHKRKHKKKKKPKQERLSQRDLRELMGTSRPTYKRVRGNVHQK